MSKDAYGFVEWFRPGEHDRVEETLPGLRASGARYLRTHLSWADYLTEGGEAWFDWLLPRLSADFDLLPCVHYTPPSLSRTGRCTGAPQDLKAYADFIDHVLDRHGQHFDTVELWNEPNNLLDWDWREDPNYDQFCEMVGGAAHWVRTRGWKVALGGPCPFDPLWLDMMGDRGVLALCDAVGFHGFPGTWDSEQGSWRGWDMHLGEMRTVLDRHAPKSEIWITETGYSTWRNDQMEQARRFAQALEAPADRLYWYGWRDLAPDVAVQEGLWFDPRHYHLGAVTSGNQPKLLARLLVGGGLAHLRDVTRLAAPGVARATRPAVVTGGAGFIGSNLADSLLADGEEVVVLDNLSRAGVEENLTWLNARHGDKVHFLPADLRQEQLLAETVADASAVFHLAAQTAVTTSLADPIEDFEVNARGTLNLLEAVRMTGRAIPLIFAGTNKVYGTLGDLEMLAEGERYRPADDAVAARGIDEARPLSFRTPYGCSKGVADQYVLDHAASFGVPAAVLRMSCVYGPRQFGTEDQGWVAHFAIRALQGEAISIFGDGRQVRDLLHVSDAVAAYKLLRDRVTGPDALAGRAFNLGGGPQNAVSLRQVLARIEAILERPVPTEHFDWRAGDQPWFVADTGALTEATGWKAKTGWQDGLTGLIGWLSEHRVTGAAPARARREKVRA